MAETSNAREQWYFTADQLQNSPSRKCGVDADRELQYRQQTAYLIQEMGQHLRVSQLCINTAIVYMHRFYAFHSFTRFHRNGIAAASLFLAAKVEEQPRKLEHVIKVANICLMQEEPTKDSYLEQAQDLVFNENVLLQTLGFDVAIDHPHTHVVKTCHLVKAGKDLAQTSYFMASNSLHLTTMCLQYKPTVVACFCIHLACKWSSWEIPNSTEGRPWFHYVDKSVTTDLLHQLTEEFIQIYQKSPSRLKNKLNSIKALVQGTKPEDGGQPQQQQQQQQQQRSGNSTSQQQPSSHRSGSTGSGGSGGHHHHHHHHHHHQKGVAPGAQQQPLPVSSSSSVAGQSQAKPSSSSSSSSSSSHRPRSDSSSKGGAPNQPQNSGRSSSSVGMFPGSGSGQGMHSNNGSRPGDHQSSSSSSAGYKSRPQMPPQQQQQHQSQAPSSMTSSSSSNKSSNNNAPEAKQPLFLAQSNYAESQKATISEEAFQFSMEDLRDPDSQDSNQMGLSAAQAAAKSQKLQSIFCPDWKEDYASGNTEHAKMNLPIGSTGDTQAPMGMHQQQRSSSSSMQRPGSASGGLMMPGNSGGNSHNAMKKPEKKPEHNRMHPHPFGAVGMPPSSSSSSNNSSIMPNQASRQVHQGHHNMMSAASASLPVKSSSSSSSSGAAHKRPYDEMMAGDAGGHDLTVGQHNQPQQQQQQDYLRDPKLRRSELDMGAMSSISSTGYDRPKEKDFNDYRDPTASATAALLSGSGASKSTTMASSSSTAGGSKFSHSSIETNPDLVSSLLKESLNTEQAKPFTTIPATATGVGLPGNSGGSSSALLSNGPSSMGSTVSTSQLDQLINAPPQPFQPLRTQMVVNGGSGPVAGVGVGSVVDAGALGAEGGSGSTEEDHHRHKSEKKKKKEKHKNKDKEKDRGSKEERKKHKKDKERNKERHHHHEHGDVLSPLKFKISGVSGGESEGSGLKIKFPRPEPQPLGSLKIKISKDKLLGKDAGGGSEGAMAVDGGGYHKKKDKEKSSKRDY